MKQKLKDIIECLKCSHHYGEYGEQVLVCPNCGNTDLEQTIYLSPDGTLYDLVKEQLTPPNSVDFIAEEE